jgi:hypothetical protein
MPPFENYDDDILIGLHWLSIDDDEMPREQAVPLKGVKLEVSNFVSDLWWNLLQERTTQLTFLVYTGISRRLHCRSQTIPKLPK